MICPAFRRALRASSLLLLPLLAASTAQAQGAKKNVTTTSAADTDHEQERAEWFLHGRTIPGKSAAELRHRAYQVKMQARAARLALARAAQSGRTTSNPHQRMDSAWSRTTRLRRHRYRLSGLSPGRRPHHRRRNRSRRPDRQHNLYRWRPRWSLEIHQRRREYRQQCDMVGGNR